MVAPCEDGYLSARIKPSSPLFATIMNEYESLLEAEKQDGINPEASAARLLQRHVGLVRGPYHGLRKQYLSHQRRRNQRHVHRMHAPDPG